MVLIFPIPMSSTKLSMVCSCGAACAGPSEDGVGAGPAFMWYFRIKVHIRPKINFSLRLRISEDEHQSTQHSPSGPIPTSFTPSCCRKLKQVVRLFSLLNRVLAGISSFPTSFFVKAEIKLPKIQPSSSTPSSNAPSMVMFLD